MNWANPLSDPAWDPLFIDLSSLSLAASRRFMVTDYFYNYWIFFCKLWISRSFSSSIPCKSRCFAEDILFSCPSFPFGYSASISRALTIWRAVCLSSLVGSTFGWLDWVFYRFFISLKSFLSIYSLGRSNTLLNLGILADSFKDRESSFLFLFLFSGYLALLLTFVGSS